MSLVVLAIIGTSAAVFPPRVFAQQPTLDKLKFVLNANKTSYYVENANTNISGAVVIPDTYNNLPVTNVGIFRGNDKITSVIFPNSIIGLSTQSFYRCTGLTSVTIPASVTAIPWEAFGGCTNLTSVTFNGSKISFGGNTNVFPGDLTAKFQAGGAGTYTRPAGSDTWTKQAGVTLCPTCGQPLPAGFKLP